MSGSDINIGGISDYSQDDQTADIIYIAYPVGTDRMEWQDLIEAVSVSLSLHPRDIDITHYAEQSSHLSLSHGTPSDDMLDALSRLTCPVLILPRSRLPGSGKHKIIGKSTGGMDESLVEFGRREQQYRHPDGTNPDSTNLEMSGHTGQTVHQLKRIVIPVDNTNIVSSKAVIIVNKFHSAGIATSLLHVIDTHTRPKIWEGSGHYIEAWREELSAHHRGIPYSTKLDTAVGETSSQVKKRLLSGDLLVILWNRDTGHNRARVLRELLSDKDNAALDIPVLLYPLR